MKDFFDNPAYFPIVFVLGWLGVTTFLSLVSGWFVLMQKYPNRSEIPVLILKNQSGSLGGVSMRSILNLSVCPSGLRIGMMRIFGLFTREFFVPWSEISITRKERFFQKIVKISFGNPIIGNLSLPAEVADRIAHASAGAWPEAGSFLEETSSQAGARIIKQWALSTGFASTFFIVAPRLAFPKGAAPPIALAILFPAIVFGIGSVFRYLTRKRA